MNPFKQFRNIFGKSNAVKTQEPRGKPPTMIISIVAIALLLLATTFSYNHPVYAACWGNNDNSGKSEDYPIDNWKTADTNVTYADANYYWWVAVAKKRTNNSIYWGSSYMTLAEYQSNVELTTTNSCVVTGSELPSVNGRVEFDGDSSIKLPVIQYASQDEKINGVDYVRNVYCVPKSELDSLAAEQGWITAENPNPSVYLHQYIMTFTGENRTVTNGPCSNNEDLAIEMAKHSTTSKTQFMQFMGEHFNHEIKLSPNYNYSVRYVNVAYKDPATGAVAQEGEVLATNPEQISYGTSTTTLADHAKNQKVGSTMFYPISYAVSNDITYTKNDVQVSISGLEGTSGVTAGTSGLKGYWNSKTKVTAKFPNGTKSGLKRTALPTELGNKKNTGDIKLDPTGKTVITIFCAPKLNDEIKMRVTSYLCKQYTGNITSNAPNETTHANLIANARNKKLTADDLAERSITDYNYVVDGTKGSDITGTALPKTVKVKNSAGQTLTYYLYRMRIIQPAVLRDGQRLVCENWIDPDTRQKQTSKRFTTWLDEGDSVNAFAGGSRLWNDRVASDAVRTPSISAQGAGYYIGHAAHNITIRAYYTLAPPVVEVDLVQDGNKIYRVNVSPDTSNSANSQDYNYYLYGRKYDIFCNNKLVISETANVDAEAGSYYLSNVYTYSTKGTSINKYNGKTSSTFGSWKSTTYANSLGNLAGLKTKYTNATPNSSASGVSVSGRQGVYPTIVFRVYKKEASVQTTSRIIRYVEKSYQSGQYQYYDTTTVAGTPTAYNAEPLIYSADDNELYSIASAYSFSASAENVGNSSSWGNSGRTYCVSTATNGTNSLNYYTTNTTTKPAITNIGAAITNFTENTTIGFKESPGTPVILVFYNLPSGPIIPEDPVTETEEIEFGVTGGITGRADIFEGLPADALDLATGELSSDGYRSSSDFDASLAIPTSEYLKGMLYAPEYLVKGRWLHNIATFKVSIPVYMPTYSVDAGVYKPDANGNYYTTVDADSTNADVSDIVVTRQTDYYDLDYGYTYTPAKGLIENYALNSPYIYFDTSCPDGQKNVALQYYTTSVKNEKMPSENPGIGFYSDGFIELISPGLSGVSPFYVVNSSEEVETKRKEAEATVSAAACRGRSIKFRDVKGNVYSFDFGLHFGLLSDDDNGNSFPDVDSTLNPEIVPIFGGYGVDPNRVDRADPAKVLPYSNGLIRSDAVNTEFSSKGKLQYGLHSYYERPREESWETGRANMTYLYLDAPTNSVKVHTPVAFDFTITPIDNYVQTTNFSTNNHLVVDTEFTLEISTESTFNKYVGYDKITNFYKYLKKDSNGIASAIVNFDFPVYEVESGASEDSEPTAVFHSAKSDIKITLDADGHAEQLFYLPYWVDEVDAQGISVKLFAENSIAPGYVTRFKVTTVGNYTDGSSYLIIMLKFIE